MSGKLKAIFGRFAHSKRALVYDEIPLRQRALLILLLSLFLALVCELSCRGSVAKLATFIVEKTGYMLFGWFIILTSLLFSELFKRREAVLALIGFLWAAVAIADLFVIGSRTQPLAFMDMFMVGEGLKLITVYYTIPQIILMFAGIFILLAALLYVATELPKRRSVRRLPSVCVFTGCVMVCVCVYTVLFSTGLLPRRIDDLINAYHEYGFVPCFITTIGFSGVSKPADYSTETVSNIVDEIDDTDGKSAEDDAQETAIHAFTEADDLAHPNVIYVQLESFFDPKTIIGCEYTSDPVPNFTNLCKQYPSAELYMPSVGGGTCNSEFEVLTGFSLDFFTTGEYPYSTILQEKTCGSIAYDLLMQGYSTSALHNSTATFYGRHKVYPRLGFRHFDSLEYMPDAEYNAIGWAKDMILDTEIMKTLRSTTIRDFIMAITVESHGKYSPDYVAAEGDIGVSGVPEQINEGELLSYLQAIRDVDKFIGKLISDLSNFNEPTIVVFYGDHLPALNLSDDILTTGSVYASRYVIWNNYGAQFTASSCDASRLSSELMDQLGIEGGVISRFERSYPIDCNDEEYLEKLGTLEYDLLYGDQAAYESGTPEPVDMTMGVVPIEIGSVSHRYGRVLVNGSGFTEFSVIRLDGTDYETAYISTDQLVCVVPDGTVFESVSVAQIASDGTELSCTDPFPVS